MAAQRKTTPIRGIIIFVVLVIISGIGLYASNNFDNPLSAVTGLFSLGAGGGQERGARPDGDFAEGTRPERGGGGDFDERGGENGSVNWSQFGEVLFNVWFISAVTAVLIVGQQTFSFFTRWMRQRSPRVATT